MDALSRNRSSAELKGRYVMNAGSLKPLAQIHFKGESMKTVWQSIGSADGRIYRGALSCVALSSGAAFDANRMTIKRR